MSVRSEPAHLGALSQRISGEPHRRGVRRTVRGQSCRGLGKVQPDLRVADDLVEVFEILGLPTPAPIPVMSIAQQASQKLHACSDAGTATGPNQRAHDLVDFQILDRVEQIDPYELGLVAPRLFAYRHCQSWPPTVVASEGWTDLYLAAAEGLDVLSSVDDAITWANDLIAKAEATR